MWQPAKSLSQRVLEKNVMLNIMTDFYKSFCFYTNASEKKMLALPPPVSITGTKDDNLTQQSSTLEQQTSVDGPLNPPIITHTAATPMGTPMATPQGSPNESTLKDSNKLTVSVNMNRSSLSVDTDKTSVSGENMDRFNHM